jgi:hypothetical protein
MNIQQARKPAAKVEVTGRALCQVSLKASVQRDLVGFARGDPVLIEVGQAANPPQRVPSASGSPGISRAPPRPRHTLLRVSGDPRVPFCGVPLRLMTTTSGWRST